LPAPVLHYKAWMGQRNYFPEKMILLIQPGEVAVIFLPANAEAFICGHIKGQELFHVKRLSWFFNL
jgi:hypothetical protein